MIDEVVKYKNAYPFVHGLMLRATRNVANVYIDHQDRSYGQAGYTLKKLLGLWMNGFTAFSEKPLRLATYVGVVNIFIALLWSIILIIQFAMGILLNYSLFIIPHGRAYVFCWAFG